MVWQKIGTLAVGYISPFFIPRRLAGHSKWANIRHVKAAKDQEKSKKFDKVGKLMRNAINEGGADPQNNPRLENLIQQARTINMPSGTIQGILKASQQSRDNAQPVLLELRGPGNTSLIVETLTDNKRRTLNDIHAFLRKHRGTLGDALHAFHRCGVVVAQPAGASPTDLDTATEHAIEVGAEDVELDPETNTLVFTTSWEQLYSVKKALGQLGYTVVSADHVFLPQTSINVGGDDAQLHDKLVEKLIDLPDVIKVYSNADVQQ